MKYSLCAYFCADFFMEKDFIFGIHPVLEALKAEKEIDKILIDRLVKGDMVLSISKIAKSREIPIVRVPEQKLNKVTKANHQGVIAYTAQVSYCNFEDILQAVFESGKNPFFLVLDRITDVRNFGAIVRTAECSGVQCIILPEKGSAQINAVAAKTSAGALSYLPISRVKSLRKAVKTLQNSGLQVVACTEKAENSLYRVKLTEPTALVLGSEEDGIMPELLENCDHSVYIPVVGNIESLNVSVAAGIAMFEGLRQRLLSDGGIV
jgi:23S rRNA (guanosine2251-2'-O)-methyltransferase